MLESHNENAANPSSWKAYYSFSLLGRCFVLKSAAGTIGSSQLGALSIALNKSLEYMILMHDPDFMMMTSNPKVVPRLSFSIDENFGGKTVYIEATIHITSTTRSHEAACIMINHCYGHKWNHANNL